MRADGDHQPVYDGEGERQFEQERGARPGLRSNFDSTPEFLHLPANHVHADAASGDIGDLFRSGKPRFENQPERVALRDCGAVFDQALGAGLGEDLGGIQPAAVIGDFDYDLAGLVIRGQGNAGLGSFAGRFPNVRRFDAVVHGVPDHVHERIGQSLGDGLIELGIFSAGNELHLLAGLSREVADLTGSALEKLADGDHPHGHGGSLHLTGDAGQLRQVALENRVGRDREAFVVAHQGLRDHHFADHVDKVVQLAGVHPHGEGLGHSPVAPGVVFGVERRLRVCFRGGGGIPLGAAMLFLRRDGGLSPADGHGRGCVHRRHQRRQWR